MRRLHYLFFLNIPLLLLGDFAPLTTQGCLKYAHEILNEHIEQSHISKDLIKKTLFTYVDILDPAKTYFLQDEVTQFTDCSPEMITQITLEVNKGNFSYFQEQYAVMKEAIIRKKAIMKELEDVDPLHDVNAKEFEKIEWAQTTKELRERALKIKSCQLNALKSISDTDTSLLLKRIEKRRAKHESDYFIDDPTSNEQHMLTLTLKALAQSCDNHTVYFTPHEAENFLIQVQQKLTGIGAQLRDDIDGLSVIEILKGGPLSTIDRIQPLDKIIAVDGEAVIGLDITDAVKLIRGKKDTTVTLTLIRPSENDITPFTVDVTRGEIVLEESRCECSLEPLGNGVIAHIKLHSFYQDTSSSSARDIKNFICNAKKSGPLYGVILDLRGNSGGLLTQAVEVSGLFIKHGVVASIASSDDSTRHLRNMSSLTLWDGPLIVGIDKTSASASEIVAQCLQDYGRALVVGDETSFGKGTMQVLSLGTGSKEDANPLGEYKVTKGIFYTVSGKTPQGVGVLSDISVHGPFSYLDIGEAEGKNTLKANPIEPSYYDSMSDLPLLEKMRYHSSYLRKQQEKMEILLPHIEKLKENSKLRLDKNKKYTTFVTDKKIENFTSDDIFTIQTNEMIHLMKDLCSMNVKK